MWGLFGDEGSVVEGLEGFLCFFLFLEGKSEDIECAGKSFILLCDGLCGGDGLWYFSLEEEEFHFEVGDGGVFGLLRFEFIEP